MPTVQSLPAAQMGFGTVKLSGAAGQADANLVTLLAAAKGVATIDDRITGATILVVAATTVYWENDGTVADATKMPILTDDTLEIQKNNHEMLRKVRIVVTGAYDIRVMLW